MNKNKSFDIYMAIGLISGILTIFDFIKNIIVTQSFTVSRLTIISFVITAIFILLFFLRKKAEFRYWIKKQFVYCFLHSSESIEILEKEVEYVFIDRTHMEHTKKHLIKSKVSQLSEFTDKLKWSKPQTKQELDIMCSQIVSNEKDQRITTTRYENWVQYSVNFDGIGKGETKKISISLKNLTDSNMDSLSFLSSNAIFKTRRMNLKVIFKDLNLKPNNIKYKIFNNYASSYPLISKKLELKYNEDRTSYIEYIENKPIPGYRYVITWEF